jgi:Tol biopolymer transport system component
VFAPTDGAALFATWSPDGKRIAFRNEPSINNAGMQNSTIWMVDADGTNAHRVDAIPSDHDPSQPAWSPDGKRLAYWDRIGNSVSVLDLSTGDRWFVAEGSEPAWSPNGQLAIDQGSTIVVVDPDTGKRITAIEGTGAAAEPTWSPDGEWIAFSSAGDIYAARPDGRDLRLVVRNGKNNWSPSWGPAPRR